MTPWIDILRTPIDLGIVIVVWLAQLIIYPSFLYVEEREFRQWHKRYARRIAFFVIPLLLSQAAILIIQISTRAAIPDGNGSPGLRRLCAR